MKKILVILVMLAIASFGFRYWNRVEEQTYSSEYKVQTATFYRIQKKLVYETVYLMDDREPVFKIIYIDEIEEDENSIIYSSSHYEYIAYDKTTNEWEIR